MTVSNVQSSSDTSATDASSNYKQTKADFDALAAALQSGDLTQSQQALAQLEKDNPRLAQALSSPPSSSDSPRIAALKSVASALQSGNVTAAQSAFSQLQQAAQATTGPHHHHHHHGGGPSAAPTDSSGNTDSTGITSSSSPGSIFQATA